MSDTTPPAIPAAGAPIQPRPGSHPRTTATPASIEPLETMPKGPLAMAEAILKTPEALWGLVRENGSGAFLKALLPVTIVCLLLYGLTAGMFAYKMQLWAAPLKTILGLFGSALICLPSLIVFSYLTGSKLSMGAITTALLGALTLVGLLLVGFGPVSWVFGQSTNSLGFMGGLHLAFLIIALSYGMRFLFRALAGNGAAGSLKLWNIVFVLVTLQMTTTLRPIIGPGDEFFINEKKFFLTHWGDSMHKSIDPKEASPLNEPISARRDGDQE